MADITGLKAHVCALAAQSPFIHATWFVEHHLLVIEQLVTELCAKVPTANPELCQTMVWVHDWGKIITNKGPEEEAVTRREIRNTLPDFGYIPAQIEKLLTIYEEMETLQLYGADFLPETKVISTADALSHYIGPFFSIFFQEYHHLPLAELIAGNQHKIARDRQKILLPEVLPFVEPRMALIAEYASVNRPTSFLN